jgi:hypothetical protein
LTKDSETALLLWPTTTVTRLFSNIKRSLYTMKWELNHKEFNLYFSTTEAHSPSQSINISHGPFGTPFLAQCDYFSTTEAHRHHSIPLIHTESQSELLSTEDFNFKYQHRVWLNTPGRKATCSVGIIWGALKQLKFRCQDTREISSNGSITTRTVS